MNNLFPVFVKLDAIRTLIVGGGKVGLEKLSGILKSSPEAKVMVVARVIHEPVKKLAEGKANVKLVERDFAEGDLDSADLVLLATDNRSLHETIVGLAHKRKMLVNVADTPDLCDFYLGSVVNKGDLKIGISTNGKSPTIAKRIREYLEEAIPDSTQELLDNMRAIRDRLKGDFEEKVRVLNEVTKKWRG